MLISASLLALQVPIAMDFVVARLLLNLDPCGLAAVTVAVIPQIIRFLQHIQALSMLVIVLRCVWIIGRVLVL